MLTSIKEDNGGQEKILKKRNEGREELKERRRRKNK